ncbi:hypothetical protein LWI29_006447 [Acer saccharum]|uniref:Uncharacterized protein n=1 Tax=Acer saccharum TaxID=4024 RepID=A0AA39VXK5_ACESA|nr:hypothetical protein LWI29_006447 [Acer saccharum]
MIAQGYLLNHPDSQKELDQVLRSWFLTDSEVQNHPEDLRHQLVKSAIDIPPRKAQSTTRPAKEEHKESDGKSKISDSEDSVARSGHNGSKRLEDQMAKMAKELEELKKGKQRGTRKNPLGEMNAPFSRRI